MNIQRKADKDRIDGNLSNRKEQESEAIKVYREFNESLIPSVQTPNVGDWCSKDLRMWKRNLVFVGDGICLLFTLIDWQTEIKAQFVEIKC